MRMTFTASAAVALTLALTSAVRAQDKPDAKPDEKPRAAKAETKLPLDPFASAKTGDWSVHVGTMKGGGVPPDAGRSLMVVDKIDDKEVTTTETQISAGGAKQAKSRTYAREGLTLERFLGDKAATIDEVKIEDDKRELGGKEFACKKIHALMTEDSGVKIDFTLWMSPEVKGGIVSMLVVLAPPGQPKMTITFDLAGFGSEGKTDWGKSLAELQKADEKKDAK